MTQFQRRQSNWRVKLRKKARTRVTYEFPFYCSMHGHTHIYWFSFALCMVGRSQWEWWCKMGHFRSLQRSKHKRQLPGCYSPPFPRTSTITSSNMRPISSPAPPTACSPRRDTLLNNCWEFINSCSFLFFSTKSFGGDNAPPPPFTLQHSCINHSKFSLKKESEIDILWVQK